MMILSHPRSGSTQFMRYITSSLMKEYNYKTVINFGELLNWGDRAIFGNLIDARKHFTKDKTHIPVPITVSTLDFDLVNQDTYIKSGCDRKIFFNKTLQTFITGQEVENFYNAECSSRYAIIKQLDECNLPYMFKHFITGSLPNTGPQNQFSPTIKNIAMANDIIGNDKNYIFYYRKDAYASVLSNLIKDCYFDKKKVAVDEKLKSWFSETFGHNVDGLMPSITPLHLKLSYSDIIFSFNDYINLLKMYKESRILDNHIVEYKDMVEKKYFEYCYNNKKIKVDCSAFESVEEPLNYTEPKQNYFTNSEIISDLLREEIKRYNLEDVVEKLGIVLDPT